jgi:hypothetical protein
LGYFVRGLTMSVSGFLGMSLCLNYVSSADSPFLVPVGLVSVFLGVVGFIVMVSGMNSGEHQAREVRLHGSEMSSGLMDHKMIKDGMDLARLDEPTAKI